MITPMKERGVVRVTVTLDPLDVDLLDRLARLEGVNRSAELRSVLSQLRPTLLATVEAFEAALRQRDQFDLTASQLTVESLEALLPEVEELQRQYLGAMARIEGKQAASEASDPRPSNHGGHTPTPPSPEEPPK